MPVGQDHTGTRPLLLAVRFGLPIAIALAGIVVLLVGSGTADALGIVLILCRVRRARESTGAADARQPAGREREAALGSRSADRTLAPRASMTSRDAER
jgi:hypothetical protein